jgi:hypothetical protein
MFEGIGICALLLQGLSILKTMKRNDRIWFAVMFFSFIIAVFSMAQTQIYTDFTLLVNSMGEILR